MDNFSRTTMLLGDTAMHKLRAASVAIFGIGGVGSYAAEAIARCGVGGIALFDHDIVCTTNINRQLIATCKTVGEYKTDVMKQRILDINPACNVELNRCFYTADNAGEYDLTRYDCIIDAIDTVSSKLTLIERAQSCEVYIISCMGAGNKLDPTAFEAADIYETSVCPLAKVMRRELRARGIPTLRVVYSKELPLKPAADRIIYSGGDSANSLENITARTARRHIPGSISFVPAAAGLVLAGEVVKYLIRQ